MGILKQIPMRILLILGALLCIGNFTYAQDSATTAKLKGYKKLYEQGLIDSQDYRHLKESLLYKDLTADTRASVEALKLRYTRQFIAGGVFMGLGLGAVVGGIVYSNKVTTPDYYKRNRALLFSTGAIVTVMGAVLVGVGMDTRAKYKIQNRAELGLLPSGQVGMSLKIGYMGLKKTSGRVFST